RGTATYHRPLDATPPVFVTSPRLSRVESFQHSHFVWEPHMPNTSAADGHPAPGPQRRTVLFAGLGGAALAATGLTFGSAGPAAPPGATGPAPGEGQAGWAPYAPGPASRTVRPTRITRATGQVTAPDALLSPGGEPTVLSRPQPTPAPRWPDGTTA